MANKILLGLLCLAFMVLLLGCTQTVNEVKNEQHINESVRVSGVAKSPVKIGDLSGYTLVDENNDSMVVATADIPAEGDKVTAKGTLKEGLLGIGYYIDE